MDYSRIVMSKMLENSCSFPADVQPTKQTGCEDLTNGYAAHSWTRNHRFAFPNWIKNLDFGSFSINDNTVIFRLTTQCTEHADNYRQFKNTRSTGAKIQLTLNENRFHLRWINKYWNEPKYMSSHTFRNVFQTLCTF